MAGIFGGADLICNIPYDKIFSPPNAFADRLAMNQLLIMRHEAGLAQVQNPADGSFYIESLSDQLGKKAMDLFKTIEAGGGFLEQLKKHAIQKKIKQNAQREQEAFDKGTKILVGSNRFSDSTEKLIHAEIRKTQKNKGKRTQIEPLILRRLSREYEHNRGKYESR
jgi:methylmalonyl-CoA mutase